MAEIVDVLSTATTLEPVGRNLKGACPWCRKYELAVNPRQGFFYCFGCKRTGNANDARAMLEPR